MQILYEDNHLLVVNKPVNVAVQEDRSKDPDCLTLLKQYLKEKYSKPGDVYLGLVHRLDRPVGGVMVFARTSKAASRLSDSLRKDEFQKTYLAVAEGRCEPEKTLRDYLVKDSAANRVHITDAEHGKLAILDYRCLDYQEGLSLLAVTLHTGRPHQIRVQLSHDGHPLWGDQRYNPKAKVGQQIGLFAARLSFPHPITHELMTFTALPERAPFTRFELNGGTLDGY